MSKTIAIQEQSQTDLAVQQYGTLEAVVDVAFANGLSVTDPLMPGQELNAIEYNDRNNDVADYYAKRRIKPATAIDAATQNIIDNDDPCNYCKCFT